MKPLFVSLLIAGAALSAGAKDIHILQVTTTPAMHCEDCENTIKSNIRFEKGVKDINTNITEQIITIKYDADKNNAEKIAESFKKFGYDAKILNDKKEESKAEKKGKK